MSRQPHRPAGRARGTSPCDARPRASRSPSWHPRNQARWSSRGAYSRTSGHTPSIPNPKIRMTTTTTPARSGIGRCAIGNRRVSGGAAWFASPRAREGWVCSRTGGVRRRSGRGDRPGADHREETGEGGGGETGVGRSHGGVQAKSSRTGTHRGAPGMTRGGEREREREMCRENGAGEMAWELDTTRLVSFRFRLVGGEGETVREATSRTAVRPAPSFVHGHPSARGPPPPRLTLRFTFHFPSSVLSPSKGKVLSAKGCLEGLSTHFAKLYKP